MIGNLLRRAALSILGRVGYELLLASLHLRYIPSVRNPSTFNEKVIARKLFGNVENAPVLADKLLVREYVRERGLGGLLSEIVWSGDNPALIPFDSLTGSYVVKCSHNSGGIRVVREGRWGCVATVIAELERQLEVRYGLLTNESWYDEVPPKVIIEELFVDKLHGIPRDYKFFVFGGVCRAIQVDCGRFSSHTRAFYDSEWCELPFGLKRPRASPVPRPSRLEEMVQLAEVLAGPLSFARVDLYLIDDSDIKFGEITLAPGAGWERFSPRKYDEVLGSYWLEG